MARKKRQSTAEDIMDLVALLPWWAGVALALFSYVLFRSLAGQSQPTITNPNQVANLLPHMFITGISGALQFLMPMLCLFGAVISFVRRKKRAGLVTTVTQSASAEALNSMSWRDFEAFVSEAFRLQGYEVKEQGGARPDGGVDLVLRKGSETFLVQCKQWKALKVGVDVIRELYGVMAAQGAAGGFVVTSGRFTDDAMAFAAGRNLRLVDGPKLFGLLQQAKTSMAQKREAPAAQPVVASSPRVAASDVPACPVCSAAMVRRTARKGSNAGAQFWGCSAYPACRGTR